MFFVSITRRQGPAAPQSESARWVVGSSDRTPHDLHSWFATSVRFHCSACLLSVGDRLKQRLRAKSFQAVLAQELAWVHERRPAALMASIAADTEEVHWTDRLPIVPTASSYHRINV